MKKALNICAAAVPILLMIFLIPIVRDDYVLTALYIFIIAAMFSLKRESHDGTVFIFGFFIMIASEYVFTSTGVETFNRNTLFGLMPVWLPFLWAYGFVVIKRSVKILSS